MPACRQAAPDRIRHESPENHHRRMRESMPTWEYITTPLLIHNTAAILNNWGSEGWELVQVVQGPEGGLVAYLKRPVGGSTSAAASAGAAAAAEAAKQFEGEGHA
jgi:hypothetical protein